MKPNIMVNFEIITFLKKKCYLFTRKWDADADANANGCEGLHKNIFLTANFGTGVMPFKAED